MRGLHRFAAREGAGRDDPARAVRPPAPPRRLPQGARRWTRCAGCSRPRRGERAAALRDVALLEFLYGTGARVSEAVGCAVDDLDLADASVLLRGKGGRHRRGPDGRVRPGRDRGLPGAGPAGAAGPPPGGLGDSHTLFRNARGGAADQAGRLADPARARPPGRACPTDSRRTRCATRSPPTCSTAAPTSGWCRNCSATRQVTTTQVYTLVTVDRLREVYATAHPRAHARAGARCQCGSGPESGRAAGPRRAVSASHDGGRAASATRRARGTPGALGVVQSAQRLPPGAGQPCRERRIGRWRASTSGASPGPPGMRAEQSALDLGAELGPADPTAYTTRREIPDPGAAGPPRPGADHRDGQPEGRRRQDHDHHQPGRGAGRVRPQGAAGRLRPAGRALGRPGRQPAQPRPVDLQPAHAGRGHDRGHPDQDQRGRPAPAAGQHRPVRGRDPAGHRGRPGDGAGPAAAPGASRTTTSS